MKFFIICFLFCLSIQTCWAFSLAPAHLDIGNVLPEQTYTIPLHIVTESSSNITNSCDTQSYTIKRNKAFDLNLTIPNHLPQGKQHCLITASQTYNAVTTHLTSRIDFSIQKEEEHNVAMQIITDYIEQDSTNLVEIQLINKGNTIEHLCIYYQNKCTNISVLPLQTQQAYIATNLPKGKQNISLQAINNYVNISKNKTIQVLPFGYLEIAGNLEAKVSCQQKHLLINGTFDNQGNISAPIIIKIDQQEEYSIRSLAKQKTAFSLPTSYTCRSRNIYIHAYYENQLLDHQQIEFSKLNPLWIILPIVLIGITITVKLLLF